MRRLLICSIPRPLADGSPPPLQCDGVLPLRPKCISRRSAKLVVLFCQCGQFDNTPVICAVLPNSTGQVVLMPSCHDDQYSTSWLEPSAQVGAEPIPYAIAIQRPVCLGQASDGVVDNDEIGSSSDDRAARADRKILAAVRQTPLNGRFGPLGKIETKYRLLCAYQITHPTAEMGCKRFGMRCSDNRTAGMLSEPPSRKNRRRIC